MIGGQPGQRVAMRYLTEGAIAPRHEHMHFHIFARLRKISKAPPVATTLREQYAALGTNCNLLTKLDLDMMRISIEIALRRICCISR